MKRRINQSIVRILAMNPEEGNNESSRRKWTKGEDILLEQAVKKNDAKNWKLISESVPGRNHVQCLQRWKKVLKPGLVKGHWVEEEDELLRKVVSNGYRNWGEVAAQVPGRTAKQCRERWSCNLDPAIIREKWTDAEDALIIHWQSVLGNKWSKIAKHMPGRTENAIKTRAKSIARAKQKQWSPHEDKIIYDSKTGAPTPNTRASAWEKIADKLPGRSKNAVKRRWKELKEQGYDGTLPPEAVVPPTQNNMQPNGLQNRNNMNPNVVNGGVPRPGSNNAMQHQAQQSTAQSNGMDGSQGMKTESPISGRSSLADLSEVSSTLASSYGSSLGKNAGSLGFQYMQQNTPMQSFGPTASPPFLQAPSMPMHQSPNFMQMSSASPMSFNPLRVNHGAFNYPFNSSIHSQFSMSPGSYMMPAFSQNSQQQALIQQQQQQQFAQQQFNHQLQQQQQQQQQQYHQHQNHQQQQFNNHMPAKVNNNFYGATPPVLTFSNDDVDMTDA